MAKVGRTLVVELDQNNGTQDSVVEDRNSMMAHSDPDANISIPLVMETENGKMVIPKNASAYSTPIIPSSMRLLANMSFKRKRRQIPVLP